MPSGGLGNLGLTCAINALIQCITHTPSLRTFFINNSLWIIQQSNIICVIEVAYVYSNVIRREIGCSAIVCL